jgi:hypothetical protein
MLTIGLDRSTISAVMAGHKREARLGSHVPAIHEAARVMQDVDARHKAGHDEICRVAP